MPGQKAPGRERREQILNAAMGVAYARRISGLTIRDVAKAAGLSPGLVLFHFKSREKLIQALLNWLLHQNSMLQANAARRPRATDSLNRLIHDECIRLASTRQRTELLFDYWLTGTRHPELRLVIRAAVRRYRQEFCGLATSALRRRGSPLSGLSADAISSAAVSFIYGCALQALIDPANLDVQSTLAVMDALTDSRVRSGVHARARKR